MYDDLLNQYISEEMYYTEAVFDNGRKKIQPVINHFKDVKFELEKTINPNNKDKEKYNNFWKCQAFKDLEDSIKDIFGFRDIVIYTNDYVYSVNTKVRVMDAQVATTKRFPIDGLVSKDGFYDKTHSIRMDMLLSYGIIEGLEPEELTAVMLHEIGHGLDPAWFDIKYHEANALSKYMLDRKGALNKVEEKEASKKGLIGIIGSLLHREKSEPMKESTDNEVGKKGFLQSILDFLTGGKYTEGKIDKLLSKIRAAIRSDKDDFSRFGNPEVFADNFARMYGLGGPLMSGLKKMSGVDDTLSRSRYAKELDRQKAIADMTMGMIKDVHKTNIHRIYALMKEYQDDLNNPKIATNVKKAIREDMITLRDVLNEYQNNFSDMQNRINKLLNEEMKKKYGIDIDKMIEDAKEDNKKEEKK